METGKGPNRYVDFLIFDYLFLQFISLPSVARKFLKRGCGSGSRYKRTQPSFKEFLLWWRTSFPNKSCKRSWSCIWIWGTDSVLFSLCPLKPQSHDNCSDKVPVQLVLLLLLLKRSFQAYKCCLSSLLFH